MIISNQTAGVYNSLLIIDIFKNNQAISHWLEGRLFFEFYSLINVQILKIYYSKYRKEGIYSEA